MATDMDAATWATADAGITMAGAEAAITAGDTQRAGPYFLEAASLGGFFFHGWIVFGRNPWFGRASLP